MVKTSKESRARHLSKASLTSNRNTITRWVEARGGKPAHVARTADPGKVGLLRIDLMQSNRELEHISWDQWFEKLDEKGLSVALRDDNVDGSMSTYCRVISEDRYRDACEANGREPRVL